jgi:putative SOS response-associated peptidase YedK
MCGRFTYKLTWPELMRLYRLTAPARNPQPRYNVCPTDTIDAVIERDGRRELVPMRWGARAVVVVEAVQGHAGRHLQRPRRDGCRQAGVREAFRRTRCLIPASGYYEWHDSAAGKQHLIP